MEASKNRFDTSHIKALGERLPKDADAFRQQVYDRLGELMGRYGLDDSSKTSYLDELTYSLIVPDADFLSIALLRLDIYTYYLERYIDNIFRFQLRMNIPEIEDLRELYALAIVGHKEERRLRTEECDLELLQEAAN